MSRSTTTGSSSSSCGASIPFTFQRFVLLHLTSDAVVVRAFLSTQDGAAFPSQFFQHLATNRASTQRIISRR